MARDDAEGARVLSGVAPLDGTELKGTRPGKKGLTTLLAVLLGRHQPVVTHIDGRTGNGHQTVILRSAARARSMSKHHLVLSSLISEAVPRVFVGAGPVPHGRPSGAVILRWE
jgi:hypothetical protein